MSRTAPVVEIFSIGTELVYGRIQDTNSFWVAQQVVNLGAHVRRVTQLTDDFEDVTAAFRASVARGTDLAIMSGGLGPTPDDLTTAALAEVAGATQVVDEAVVADYMVRRNIPNREDVPPNLERMALVPSTAQVLLNPVGWAPCVVLDVDATTFVAMPGPPKEMEAVFLRHVVSYVSEHYQVKTATQRVLIDGYESAVAPYFQELMKQYPGSYVKGYIALQSQPGWLPADLLATGEDPEDAQRTLQEMIDTLRKMLAEAGKTLTVYAEAADAD